MEPTLRPGDHIVVTPSRVAVRGDVVVFRNPRKPEELMVKRVVGTAGDLIEGRNGRVVIGGHALAELYLREPAASGAIAAQIIPAGCYFVMGDNRGDSFDSRHWGVLPGAYLVGRARFILWSSNDSVVTPTAQAASRTPALAASGTARVTRLFRRIE